MLTGKPHDLSTPWRKEAEKWRGQAGQNPKYHLKLFERADAENAKKIETAALEEGRNLPEKLFVRLEEVALLFLTHRNNIFCCTSLPWRSKEGDWILLYPDQATQFCKTEFISYPEAERLLQSRFDHLSRQEIALWLEHGELTAKGSPLANAVNVPFRHQIAFAEQFNARQGGDMPTLESLLIPLYFSEPELNAANPKRWLSYDRLTAWANETYGWDEAMLKAIIKPYLDGHDDGIRDPTPRSLQEHKLETSDDKIKRAMYHSDWIAFIESKHATRIKLANEAEKQRSHIEEVSKDEADRAIGLARQPKLYLRHVLELCGEDFGLKDFYEIDENRIKAKGEPDNFIVFPCSPMAFYKWCKDQADHENGLTLHLCLPEEFRNSLESGKVDAEGHSTAKSEAGAEESAGGVKGATETGANSCAVMAVKPALGHPIQLSANSPAMEGKSLEIERADEWREMLLAVIAEYQAKYEAYPTWPQFWGFLLENPPKEFGVTVHSGKRGVHHACVKMGEVENLDKSNLKKRFDRLLKLSIKLPKTDC